jgi:hypothetical protein
MSMGYEPIEHTPDSTLVDGTEVVDKGVRNLRETALSRRKLRVEGAFALSSCDGDDSGERSTASKMKRLRFFSKWSMLATSSVGRVTVMRSVVGMGNLQYAE